MDLSPSPNAKVSLPWFVIPHGIHQIRGEPNPSEHMDFLVITQIYVL